MADNSAQWRLSVPGQAPGLKTPFACRLQCDSASLAPWLALTRREDCVDDGAK